MYFKATILMSSELFENNNPSQGCKPETYENQGVIDEMSAYSLEDLKYSLKLRYSLDDFHVFENRLEGSFAEYNHKENLHYLATYIISISKVEEEDVDASIILK